MVRDPHKESNRQVILSADIPGGTDLLHRIYVVPKLDELMPRPTVIGNL